MHGSSDAVFTKSAANTRNASIARFTMKINIGKPDWTRANIIQVTLRWELPAYSLLFYTEPCKKTSEKGTRTSVTCMSIGYDYLTCVNDYSRDIVVVAVYLFLSFFLSFFLSMPLPPRFFSFVVLLPFSFFSLCSVTSFPAKYSPRKAQTRVSWLNARVHVPRVAKAAKHAKLRVAVTRNFVTEK